MTEDDAVTRPIIGIENRTAQEVFDIMCGRFRAALAAAIPLLGEAEPVAWTVPDGWKLVPLEPTEAMTQAGFSPFMAAHDPFFNKNEPCGPIYKVMLRAAPPPPAHPSDLLARVLEVLEAHHKWHLAQTDEDEHGIVPADAYAESGLCDQTTAALRAARTLRDEIEKEMGR